MKINWAFVLWGTVIGADSIIALADFLQGGAAWPCLFLAIVGLALASLRALR